MRIDLKEEKELERLLYIKNRRERKRRIEEMKRKNVTDKYKRLYKKLFKS